MLVAEIVLKLTDEKKNPLTLTLVSAWEEETNNWNSNARYRLFATIYPHTAVKICVWQSLYRQLCKRTQ